MWLLLSCLHKQYLSRVAQIIIIYLILLQVLATAADGNLGGQDFDVLLRDHFREDFKQRYRVDALNKPRAHLRLLQESEKMKKLMSANATPIPINIECFMEDKDVTGKLKREDLEGMAASLLQRFEMTVKSAVESSGKKEDKDFNKS